MSLIDDEDLYVVGEAVVPDELRKFKIAELGRIYRLSPLWWPVMIDKSLEYSGVMPIEMLHEQYQKYVQDLKAASEQAGLGEKPKVKNQAFASPLVLRRYQAYEPGVGYLQARDEGGVKKLTEVFQRLGRKAPKFSPKIVTMVAEWPVNKNGLPRSPEILADDMEIRFWFMNAQKYDAIRTMANSGKVFAGLDLLVKTNEKPLSYQKYVPQDTPGSTFLQLVQTAVSDKAPDEKKELARQIVEKILKVVANRDAPVKDQILKNLGTEHTPQSLLEKLTTSEEGGAGATSTGPDAPDTSVLEQSGIDVDDMLSSLTSSD